MLLWLRHFYTAHFNINFIPNYMRQDSDEGYKYVFGDQEIPAYGNILNCCGKCVGCCKAWCPCCGCICCCEDPYVQVPQGSQGILTQFGKYQHTCQSGLHYVNPMSEEMILIDCRITVIDLPVQSLMTKDNISIQVDSCIFYHIEYPELNYYRVEDIEGSLCKALGGLIKNTISAFTFQELLEKKDEIAQDISYQVGPTLREWGVYIDNICMKNFAIGKDVEAEFVSAPIARRRGDSKMIYAQGQVQIARMLNKRSQILNTKTAIQIRYLQTLEKIAVNNKSCMIYRSF